jgi:hypothetical protein
MRKLWVIAGLTLLGACGSVGTLQPATGKQLPVAAYGETARPGPDELLAARPQERPQRNDELLTQSDNRTADPYDLPPQ